MMKRGLKPYVLLTASVCPNNLAGTNRKKMKGIIGKKIGMTSIFDPAGKQTACTIIEAGPCVVTQVRRRKRRWLQALQVAFGDKKEKHTTRC
jgi:hypothetical protein